MTLAYPLALKRGMKILFENQSFTVRSVDKFRLYPNHVGVETSTGCYLLMPISEPVEVQI